MSITGLAIIYVIIWWIVFFAILPIDVNRAKTVKIDGEDPGSPENPKMLKKFLYCTCLLYTSPSPRDMRRHRMPSSA